MSRTDPSRKNRTISELALARRTLLAAFGLGGASYFLPSFRHGGSALAAEPGPPKRLIVVFSQSGIQPDRWSMRRPGLDETSDWEFPLDDPDPNSFSEILRPLHGHRSQMLVLDGLSNMTALADPTGINDHYRGWCTALTGSKMVPGTELAGGPSLDQIVGADLYQPGQLKSLELSIGGYLPAIWAARGAGLPAELSASRALDRLFPKLATTPPMTPTDLDRVRSAEAAVLELTGSQFEAAALRLSGEDRRKLELHRDMMRDLAHRLSGVSRPDCTRPTLPPIMGAPDFIASGKQMNELATAALACNLTPVVTLQMGPVTNSLIGAAAGVDLHNEYYHDMFNEVHPNSADVIARGNAVHASVIADLLSRLGGVPEGTGTMLDNTVVAWFHEIATGRHGFHMMPYVLFGNVGNYFKLGRYLRYAPNQDTPALPRREIWEGQLKATLGPPHNKLMVSLVKALGLSHNQIGETSVVATKSGATIDLTGTLDRLATA